MNDVVTTSRYDASNKPWPAECPPITAIEAMRAYRRLFGKFVGHAPARTKPRRCWISPRPTTTLHKGWRRLVHDLSHTVFAIKHPTRKPHDFRHAQLEAEIVAYVLASGWLDGKLRPRKRATGEPVDPHAAKRARIAAAVKRWESKARRARNALAKLQRKQRYLDRVSAAASPG